MYTSTACPRYILRDVTLQKLPQNHKSPPNVIARKELFTFFRCIKCVYRSFFPGGSAVYDVRNFMRQWLQESSRHRVRECSRQRPRDPVRHSVRHVPRYRFRHGQCRFVRNGLCISLFFLSACNQNQAPTPLSEQPPASLDTTEIKTSAREGTFGIRSRISYADIQAIIESEIPASHPVTGSKRICKRMLGLKACGTANWNMVISRSGAINVNGHNDTMLIKAPISFNGIVGMDGRVAKVLGLSKLDIRGSVIADISLGLDVDESWCPRLSTTVSYRWEEKPTAVWNNKIDFSLETVVNGALDKQLADLEPRLNAAVDCAKFRQQIQEQWRVYSFAIDLPGNFDSTADQNLHLNFTPTGFAFSGVQTASDNLGFGFAIDGTSVVESTPAEPLSLNLPALKKIPYQQSRTDFDILIRSNYPQLESLIKPQLEGKTFTADSIAGTASVTINTVGLASNANGVTISIGFTAKLPGKRSDTPGQLFLMANPVVDPDKEELLLEDIRLSKVLDSALWDLLSSIFENQIIAAIERNAVLNYSSRMRELESKIATQLSNPDRTAGLNVAANDISIDLLDIIPESTALAIVARVGADLDIDVPLSLIHRKRNK